VLFKEGRFSDAIDLYTKAIALDRLNHVYVYNRAVAYLKLSNYAKALEDANTSIENKRDYIKAYITKGSALRNLQRYEEAISTFKAALEIDPSNSNVQMHLKDCEAYYQNIQNPSSSTSSKNTSTPSSNSNSSNSTTSTSTSSNSSTPSVNLVPTNVPEVILLYGRFLISILFISYLLPLGSLSRSSYYYMLLASFIVHLAAIFVAHGVPNMSQAYLVRVATDPYFHLIPLAFVFYMTKLPYFLIAVVVIDLDFLHFLNYLYLQTSQRSPFVAKYMVQASQYILQFLSSKPISVIKTLSTEACWAIINEFVLTKNAELELYVGILLVVQLFTGARNFLALFAMWQILQLRYATSSHSQRAFRSLDLFIRTKALPLLNRVSPLFQQGYDNLARMLYSRVDPANYRQNQQQPGGMFGNMAQQVASSCNIM
jgi:Transmembrane protein 33/Nucleoporin POM33/Tetratricopeptide repeat